MASRLGSHGLWKSEDVVTVNVDLPSGLRVSDAERRLLRYCDEEYCYYDGIPSPDANQITPLDVLVTTAVNAFSIASARRIREIHRGFQPLAAQLADIPPDAYLASSDAAETETVRRLLQTAVVVPGVLLAVATKGASPQTAVPHSNDGQRHRRLLPQLQRREMARRGLGRPAASGRRGHPRDGVVPNGPGRRKGATRHARHQADRRRLSDDTGASPGTADLDRDRTAGLLPRRHASFASGGGLPKVDGTLGTMKRRNLPTLPPHGAVHESR